MGGVLPQTLNIVRFELVAMDPVVDIDPILTTNPDAILTAHPVGISNTMVLANPVAVNHTLRIPIVGNTASY